MASPSSSSGLEGAAARALFLAHAGRCFADERLLDAANENLQVALSAVEGETGSLFFGLAGTAWVVAMLDRSGILESDPELLATLDDTLMVIAQTMPHYDCISGLVGLGNYFLERSRTSNMHPGLEIVLHQIELRAERDARGARWKTAPEWLAPLEQLQAPNGYYNLGVAHGLGGVILLLAQCFATGFERPRTHSLLEPAIAELRHHGDETGVFRMWDAPAGECPEAFGAAWCYGGLGAALALANAGRAVGHGAWLETARVWGLCSADRTSTICDASLCHGSAGAALLFDALERMTGDDAFAEHAAKWRQSTLDFGNDPEGIGGFRTWLRLGEHPHWVRNEGVLSGASGIGLYLISQLFPEANRSWARPFVGAAVT